MDEKIRASWERALHPETLKNNIITASIFSMAFEMLKSSIVEKIEGFFTNGFDQNGPIISPEYKEKVLSLNRSPVYASLRWLQDMDAINDQDMGRFEHVKKCRNTLTHEMLSFAVRLRGQVLRFALSENQVQINKTQGPALNVHGVITLAGFLPARWQCSGNPVGYGLGAEASC